MQVQCEVKCKVECKVLRFAPEGGTGGVGAELCPLGGHRYQHLWGLHPWGGGQLHGAVDGAVLGGRISPSGTGRERRTARVGGTRRRSGATQHFSLTGMMEEFSP